MTGTPRLGPDTEDAADGVDLLTVLLHEQGHLLGLEDSLLSPGDVMFGLLSEGERRLPVSGQAAGVIPTGIATPSYLTAGDLIISEVMTDSAIDDNWEWVEIFNSTGATVDLSGFVLDDINSTALGSSNIASGSIAPGQVAVLFNDDDLNAADFEAAWGTGINLIGVTNWSALSLNNSGETVSIWEDFASYSGDHTTHANAISTAVLPSSTDSTSFFLADLFADTTSTASWSLSTAGAPLSSGFTSSAGGGNTGGEIGSPGVVPIVDFSANPDSFEVDNTASTSIPASAGLLLNDRFIITDNLVYMNLATVIVICYDDFIFSILIHI